MALEMFGVNWSSFYDSVLENQEEEYGQGNWDNGTYTPDLLMMQRFEDWSMNGSSHNEFSSSIVSEQSPFLDIQTDMLPVAKAPRRRRRSREKKNKEEIENQRMTHIAVERNRRKQMNDYLSIIRGLMPDSYSQKGDQASIIGGAINYVKELEQELHFLSGQKGRNEKHEQGSSSSSSQPFEEFFTLPQYSTSTTTIRESLTSATTTGPETGLSDFSKADIEVTMVDNHVNLKIRSKKRFKKLAKMVGGLESHRLSVLHLNITTVDFIVFCCFSLKVEHDCMLRSSEDIIDVVKLILMEIEG